MTDVPYGLADAVAHTRWDDAPAEVRDRVIDLVADCVAVTAAGSARPEVRQLVDLLDPLSPHGEASVIGSPRGWPPLTAMALNATALASDQLQDGHRLARGHPASHVVPAVLALAEQSRCITTEALSAILAGYELGVRVGRAMGGTITGVHDIGTWGQVGVAAAIARLFAPGDPDAVLRAITLAGSAVLVTEADTVFDGHAGSHTFLGSSVSLGAQQGLAAVAGMGGSPGSLGSHLGSVAAIAWDVAALNTTHPWSEYEILNGYIKVHATCAHLHGINDAVADLVSQGVEVAQIATVDVDTFAAAAQFDDIAEDDLSAHFSIPTSVAVGLIAGRVDETSMTTSVVQSRAVQDLASAVVVRHDPELDSGYPDGRPARVTIRLHGGSTIQACADRPRGDADHPLTRDQLREKARRLIAGRFGDFGYPILATIDALADGGSLAALTASVTASAKTIR